MFHLMSVPSGKLFSGLYDNIQMQRSVIQVPIQNKLNASVLCYLLPFPTLIFHYKQLNLHTILIYVMLLIFHFFVYSSFFQEHPF